MHFTKQDYPRSSHYTHTPNDECSVSSETNLRHSGEKFFSLSQLEKMRPGLLSIHFVLSNGISFDFDLLEFSRPSPGLFSGRGYYRIPCLAFYLSRLDKN
ncbi:hypothetical protein CDAR_239761 [Caerostris darwini]|uniref:Uncharacterized protein n=1 Tax=Caerostris darwini TaxID=1538125 RepID=A0AAV4QYR8_9ARAC|nr:hypothetical protein CDAR_239761 [Caerostris darwini]